MSLYRRGGRSSKIYLGHLKLSVVEDASALVVQIFEARGLQGSDGGVLNTYVKLYLLPDLHKLTKAKTKIVKQRDPTFNEKFSLVSQEALPDDRTLSVVCFSSSGEAASNILSESDQEKQLFISVWIHHMASRNEMIGCMTFNIADIVGPNKGLNGWYQMLDVIKGRVEHSQVPTSISKHEAAISKYETVASKGQKIFPVTIMKSAQGYGFSVYGHNPVFITQVTQGLPAANADVRVGDVIVELEGTDVSQSTGHHVVKIIRRCPVMLHLIVQRDLIGIQPKRNRTHSNHHNHAHLYQPFNSPMMCSHPKSYLSVASNNHIFKNGTEAETLPILTPLPVEQRKRYGEYYKSQAQLCQESHGNLYFSSSDLNSSASQQLQAGARRRPRPLSVTYGVPGVLSQPTLIYGPQDEMEMNPQAAYGNTNVYNGRGNQITEKFGSGVYYGECGQMSYGTSAVLNSTSRKKVSRNNSSLNRAKSEDVPIITTTGADFSAPLQTSDSSKEFRVIGGGSMRVLQHSKPPKGGKGAEKRLLITQHNEEGEENNEGAVGYTPFTHEGILSTHQLEMCSYNIPRPLLEEVAAPTDASKTTAVDWESLTRLEKNRQKVIHNMVTTEVTLVTALKAGMKTYFQPLQSILSEKSHQRIFLAMPELLRCSTEVVEKLILRQMPYSCQVSSSAHYFYAVADVYATKFTEVTSILHRYTQNFKMARQEIALSYTNDGFTKLVQESVEVKGQASIYSFVEVGQEYVQKLSKWMTQLLYATPIGHQDQNHLLTLVEALLPLTMDKEMLLKMEKDKEMMWKKQVCVGFGPKVGSFPILVPGRFLLHEGEVLMIEKKKKKKLWMMLFSDIVLLTRRNGKILTCVEDPVFLENLMVPDINCNESTDFQLVVAEGTFSRLLRAANVASREEWVEKLRERASGSLANRRRTGEKTHLHHYQEVLRKQSHIIAATLAVDAEVEVIAHKSMTPILESATGSTQGMPAMDGAGPDKQDSPITEPHKHTNAPLKRRVSKRKGLFNVGGKKTDSDGSSSATPGSSSKTRKGKDKKKGAKSTVNGASATEHADTPCLNMIRKEVLQGWETSFNSLLMHVDGIRLFEDFLKSEFSEENIQFWKACEHFKTVPDHMVEKEATIIYEEYIDPQASKLVNIDHQTSREIEDSMKCPTHETFTHAQQSIYLLMARDSFVRFIKSEQFQSAFKR